MTFRLKGLIAALCISLAMWAAIIYSGVMLYARIDSGIDPETTASVK